MHTVKTRARQEAWSNGANPWGHPHRPSNKRQATTDIERGYSQGRIPTQDELQRETSNISPSLHAFTEPLPGSRNDSIPRTSFGAAQPQQAYADTYTASVPSVVPMIFAGEKQRNEENASRSEPTSETVTNRGPSDEVSQMEPTMSTTKEANETNGYSTARLDDNVSSQPTKKSHFSFLKRRKKGSESDSRRPSERDDKKEKQKFKLWPQIKATVFGSWINILLFCVPVGIALHYVSIADPVHPKVSPVVVFVINFLAIIPLAGILSYATEEIALRVGETLGGLLNASFGNAVELIVSIIALAKNEILIVQTSLIGSMLSNLLLVLGMCFFAGGFNRKQQFFNVTVAQTAASLLALAVGSLIIPTVFADWASDNQTPAQAVELRGNIAPLSRATAVLLLVIYACYLFFQLKSHADMYSERSEKVPTIPINIPGRHRHADGETQRGISIMGAGSAAQAGGALLHNDNFMQTEQTKEEEEEQPQLSAIGAIVTLCIATALVGICAEFMVDGISAVTQTGHISPEFVGLILIPIVGNAAEHATAVTVALKDKMDLAIGVCVGSSMQIALLVLPLVVVIGWIMGKSDMTLNFDGFQIAILFVAVLLVNYLIQDGKSHWLEGVMLMVTYLIIAVAAWFYPASTDVVG